MRKNNRDFSSPLHSQLREILLDAINKKKLKVGQKIPSERELSEIYKVSRTTVRKTIVGLAREGILIRAPGRGTFVNNHLDSGTFVRSKTGNIGFAILLSAIDKKRPEIKEGIFRINRATISDSFYSEIFETVNQELHKVEKNLLFFSGYQDVDPDMLRFRKFLKKIDGAVICEATSPEFVRFVGRSNFPIILMSPGVSSTKVDSVVIDSVGGAYSAVNYLIKLNHKRIGLINHPIQGNYSASERLKGYKLALKESGLDYDESMVEEGDWSVHSGFLAMKRLLEKKADVTAIFATNDHMAIGAIKAIREKGLDVPKDISVVGFDDTDISLNTLVPLTTVRVHRREMGRLAAQRVIQKIEKPDLVPIRVVFPTDLVKRESCSERKS